VAAPDLEVVGVVARGDLQGAGAEVGLDVVVGDDRQVAPDEGQHRRLADQVAVALVVGVDRHRGVGQHRLGAHGRNHDLALAVGQRVGDLKELVGDLALLDLEVGDGRARPRVPVDEVVVAIDEALVVEVDEDLHDRLHVALVEREALVLVVHGEAQALELLDDRAAVLLAPLPDALDERLAPELLAARPLVLQGALDLLLGRDPGVVGAEDPLGPAPAHALVANEGVLDGAVERMAHVQDAGDVRRRDGDRVVLLGRPLGIGVVQARRQPALDDPRLDLGGLEAGAVLQAGHRPRESTQRVSEDGGAGGARPGRGCARAWAGRACPPAVARRAARRA